MNLPTVSRTDRLLLSIVLVMAMLVGLLTWAFRPPEKTGNLFELPSTFFNAGYGAKASYLALDRLGFPVTRLRRPIVPETLGGIGTLFVLKPLLDIESRELNDLEQWVKSGHALVVAPGSFSYRRCKCNSFAPWFNLADASEDEKKKDEKKTTKETPHKQEADCEPPIDASDPIMKGVGHLTVGSNLRFSSDEPCDGPLAKLKPHVFWRDKLGVLGFRVELGEGEIIALADTYALSNLGLSEADNGLLLGNLARRLSDRYPGEIAFDEYHLGFRQQKWSSLAMVELMLAGNWRWAAVQAILVGLLALGAGSVRFGSPKDVIRRPRRQHREFAEAAGRLLDEAGATALAAETLLRHYRGQLCRLMHLEPEADDSRLAAAVRSRSGQEIAALLEEARVAATVPVGRKKLLAISQELYHTVETIAHGT